MPIEEVKTICFAGAGTMGCYNALAAAISGYRAVLFDVEVSALEKAPARQRELAALFVGAGYCSEADIAPALARISVAADLALATAEADLVSESVFERLDVKRDIHRRLDQACPSNTILTTNSSALLVSEIEDAVARGDRFAALHTHFGSPLVDIVPGPRTSPETIEILRRYTLSVAGVPLVLKKEHPGYLLNAMLGSVLAAALALHLGQDAQREDIDRAWMRAAGAPMGPFGLMDLFGLDVIRDSWQHGKRDAARDAIRPAVISLLSSRVERGDLGSKSGCGFYRYPAPAYQAPDFLQGGGDDSGLYRSLAVVLVSTAIHLAAEAVAELQDIDLAWRVGMSLDAGPFALLAGLGRDAFLAALEGEVAASRMPAQRARAIGEWLALNPAVFKDFSG